MFAANGVVKDQYSCARVSFVAPLLMYGVSGLSLVQASSSARFGGFSGVASYSRNAISSEGKTSAIDMLLAINSGMMRDSENL